ncbi:MAG: LysR family transcriptional regulator [Gammaproteobacteria bacterium]|nr:LysR family transcriptional regulator [Gammaproteobacteria bacterium]MDE2261306.1 LysR family transcriptional regulator [Gammaproteobacteria bacterium]
MELRHLRYFLAVAEELNFTRAAERLGISQPPLTQQVKALEAELGVTLLDRSAYRIELTDAGRIFAAEAARILGDARSAVQAARRAATGATGRVRVGFTESASFNSLVTATLRSFRSDYPAVEVSLEEHPSTDLILALRLGRIDTAFVRPPLPAQRGLTLHLLEKEPLVVAVPSGHALAGRPQVDLAALAAETFILYPRAVRPGLADTVVAACEAAGFTPKVGQYAPQLSSTINLVAASLGISIVPESMRCLQALAVTYLPLSGEPLHALLGIAYRTDESSAVVHNFVDAARRGRSAGS